MTLMNVRSIAAGLAIAACAGSAGAPLAAQGQRQGGAGPVAGRAAPINPDEVPRRKKPAPLPPRGTYKPPRTSWGDPDIAGAYNNSDETSIPFERPNEFAGRTLDSFTPAELEQITKQRQERTIEANPTLSEFPGATSPMHWFENYFAANSRAWLVVDPPDGKVPPVTDEARQRAAARAAAAQGRGPADSWEDRSLYDRCITRGVPGSMMPAIYGNSYQISRARAYVDDHLRDDSRDARDSARRPPAPRPGSGSIMGDARGHWEGDTLVVETTNFNDRCRTADRAST